MIPGLEDAEFLRYGSIHRNSYLNFPARLAPHGGLPERPELIFAGQLTGVEGYTESTASGLLAALNLDRIIRGLEPVTPPTVTMLGGVYRYLREADPRHFQPMNANFGLVEALPNRVRGRKARREAMSRRAVDTMREWRDRTFEPGAALTAGTTAR
jgi:methylenetetrahydrofolate--tRNA-(uracil-5-)-methyltransferase